MKKVIAVRPGAVADGQRVAWEYSKGTGYVLSNILYGDYLYLFTDNGIVTCLDPKTGAVKYEGGRIPVPARFMGSPVAFGGFVAMTSEAGDTFMLRPDRRTRSCARTQSTRRSTRRPRSPTAASTSAPTSTCSRSVSSDS